MLVRLKDFKPELLPIVAIGAFAGIRTAELSRLKWEDFKHGQKFIKVGANKAKTGQHRHVPIHPTLAAWLEPFAGKKGHICEGVKIQVGVRKIVEPMMETTDRKPKPGVKWKHNALRHSYGSYRHAILKNMAELAVEMGNSPRMILNHYRELVQPDEAAKFWAIMPPAGYAQKMAVALAKVEAADTKKKG